MSSDSPQSVELFTYALSPFGVKVYWALVYKQIDFDLIYVSGKDQREISFSDQSIVPVTRIGEEWKQDSRETCIWLDEVFEGRKFAGSNELERQAIIDADDWVNRNIIALFFRQAIDKEESGNAFKIGRILSDVMREAQGEVPWITRFFWPYFMRRSEFVRREVAQIDADLSCSQHRERVLRELEKKIKPTGYIAGTDEPTFADINAFGQLMTAATFKFPGQLAVEKSNAVFAWLQNIQAKMPKEPNPSLVPYWTPKRWI